LPSSALLVAIEVMAVSIWVGGMVCIAIVARVARDALDEVVRPAFFRSLGRRYAMGGTTSLLVVIAAGLAPSWPSLSSSGTIDAPPRSRRSCSSRRVLACVRSGR
jgi:putative copper export protein